MGIYIKINIKKHQARVIRWAWLNYLLIILAAPTISADSSSFNHALLTAILQKYVSEQGGVNYQGLKDEGYERLAYYVKQIENAPQSLMSEQERMAFYINAYNAFTLKLIVDSYPLESIRKIPGLSGVTGFGQWKKEMWTLNGKKVSLDDIEHKLLRPMGDPRIHFALVCAAKSCPSLARKAYTSENLDEMLQVQGRRFNQGPKGLQVSNEKRVFSTVPVLKLSAIYKWFQEDFLQVSEDLPNFVYSYANAETQAFIEKNRKDLRIEYLDYDWSLNNQPR